MVKTILKITVVINKNSRRKRTDPTDVREKKKEKNKKKEKMGIIIPTMDRYPRNG